MERLRNSRAARGAILMARLAGWDPQATARLRFLPRYLGHLLKWRKMGGSIDGVFPSLGEHLAEGGTARGHYFWQDLLVAQEIYRRNPKEHIDIGSRFDGFVSHVASFRPIRVMDIRPVSRAIPNVTFVQADALRLPDEFVGCAESVSSLHAIEHFGLGRYGDPLCVDGHVQGIKNILRIARSGGRVYLSVPIGKRRVIFDGHRILDPRDIVDVAASSASVEEITIITDSDEVVRCAPGDLDAYSNMRYGCGIYFLAKT